MKIAIVLGNRLGDDGAASELMMTRLKLTRRLLGEEKIDKIIVSGGVANALAGISEAAFMKKWLVGEGVAEDLIVVEDNSRTTKENAAFSVPLALSMGATEIFLVSSREHMYRWYLNPRKIFRKALKGTGVKLLTYTNKDGEKL
jgi:uncharacterized SAM-binding protein YcdF (DUF218 family)